MKQVKLIMVTLLMIAVSFSMALAIEGGDPKKGKYLFKKNCKVCHNSRAIIENVTPASKTMAQWDTFFVKKKHDLAKWEDLSSENLKDINQFVYNYAVDTEQPETCGGF